MPVDDTASAKPLPPMSILVLGLVAERPMHPYEMVQTTLARREHRVAKFRAGTLYHAVDRLLGSGLIEVHEVKQEGNRPERTVYTVTEAGLQALESSLERILERHPLEYPELHFALSEAHNLPRQRVVELLTERVSAMRVDRDAVQEMFDTAHADGVPEMFYLDLGCRAATLTTQIEWTERLIDRLAADRLDWLDDPGHPYAHIPPAERARLSSSSKQAKKEGTR